MADGTGWFAQVLSDCGQICTAASTTPRRLGGCLWWEVAPPLFASAFSGLPWVTGWCDLQMTLLQDHDETSLHVQSENFCPGLYWSCSAAADLRCYLVEDVVYLLLHWSSLASLGN